MNWNVTSIEEMGDDMLMLREQNDDGETRIVTQPIPSYTYGKTPFSDEVHYDLR